MLNLLSKSLFVGTACFVLTGIANAVENVYLNVPTSDFNVPSLIPSWTARYRFDTGGGVDQMLFKQPNPAGYPARDLLRMNSTFTGTATYQFSVAHDAATNLYTYSLTNGAVTGGASFASGTSANSTLTRTFDPGIPADKLDYNILHIFVRAQSGSTVSFSNLAFTPGAGLTNVGTLDTSEVTTGADYDQWLATKTGTNLDDFDWSFSGSVTLQMNGVRPSAELLKFELTGKSGAYTPPQAVPEPATLAILGAGAIALLRRRRSA